MVGYEIELDRAGRLCFVPHGAEALATLCFGQEGMAASIDDVGVVVLPWALWGVLNVSLDASPGRDGWVLASMGHHDPSGGIELRVAGEPERQAARLAAANRRWGRTVRQLRQSSGGSALAVLPAGYFSTFQHELETLSMLCRLLHDRPALHERLGDRSRMSILAAELRSGIRIGGRPGHFGVRRDSVDVDVAIRSAGLNWRYGRPLSPNERPALDSAVERVEQRLQANPYRAGRRLDHDLVVHIVRKEVVDVEPWPFSALVAN